MDWTRHQLLEHMETFDLSTDEGHLVFADYLEENCQLGWAMLCRLFTTRMRSKISFHRVFHDWVENDSNSSVYGICDWKAELVHLNLWIKEYKQ